MDQIVLTVPAKPEYAMVIRLTASAIASRAEFSMDEIEDIKAAVAEAAIIIMNQNYKIETLKLVFTLQNQFGIKLDVYADKLKNEKTSENNKMFNELSFFLIESLMENVDVKKQNDIIYSISMCKKCGGN